MIKFYYHPSPNPAKIALFLEESGLPYELVPIDTQKGEQHSAAYLAINPNGKTPAIVDEDTGAVVFDSNAILLYLAEKAGQFLPAPDSLLRAEVLSWLMFIATGIGPFSGQAVHFRHFAPEPKTYALNRYDFEAWRHWRILDARLARRQYLVGKDYSIVDIAFWGWARAIPFILGDDAWDKLPNVKRLFDEINARPAAGRAENVKDAHAFKTAIDAETLAAMYPQNARLAIVANS
ncbi:glutathione S-transferase family protein [Undibacterium sp. Ji42W]|uniref:glutathione S-transferase family protein n=1 Tax=Undibacterium sp. Ji42W TaxID=3413039 RepID=UPI003BF11CB2